MNMERKVILSIEPSKRLSEILGFPYFIDKKFTLGELLDKGIITEADIVNMEDGKQICKSVSIEK